MAGLGWGDRGLGPVSPHRVRGRQARGIGTGMIVLLEGGFGVGTGPSPPAFAGAGSNPLPRGEGARREQGPRVLPGGGGLDGGGFGAVSGGAGGFDRGTDGFCGNFFLGGLRFDDLLLWTGDRGIGGFNLC